ncbi:MAG: DNA-binding protein [Eubacteriales bacterium]|nr:DNA-binding protein [Eubacteriales bacterium]MDD4323813.1 DNA-binding protein [Eubacteriales bacterium]MDD4541765.1 DNA-binding protein [Eubacteriales bacterium]
MEYKEIADTIILRVDPGEDIVAAVETACSECEVKLGSIMGIGACNDVEIGIYLVEEQRYARKTIREEMELTSLLGNVSTMDGELYIHLHANFGNDKMEDLGGHLNRAIVSGTGEIIINKIAGTASGIDRKKSPVTGINELKFD